MSSTWIVTNQISDVLREPPDKKLQRELYFNTCVMTKDHLKIFDLPSLWVKPHYSHVECSHPRTKLQSEVRFQNGLYKRLVSI